MADIELVIKIPEERFRDIQRIAEVQLELNHFKTAEQIIAKGTPLPKGHGRLKDENEIKQMIENAKVKNESSKNLAENIIKFASTIIEADNAESEDKE